MLHLEAPRATVSQPLLEIRDLTKVYGATAALAGVDLTLGSREIHALLGENGAGKSTLVRILAAVDHEDAGQITLAGERIPMGRTPRSMSERGVAFIHQDLGLVATMTVAENIAQYAGYALGRMGIDWDGTRTRARDALDRLDVDLDPDALVGELSIAEQATVAIVRALALNARVIVLDEPTASLAAGEARRLLAILHRLRVAGISCILVTHRIDEVLAHCDRVTVLRNGAVVGTRDVAELSQAALVEMIVGEVVSAPSRQARVRSATRARLELAGFAGPAFGPIDLQIAPGEIVAVTGFADAGHLRLVDAIFGVAPSEGGSIRIDGSAYRPVDPARALRCGLQYVPSDRNAAGLAATLSARENLFPNPAQRGLRLVNRRLERRRAEMLLDTFDVRPRDPDAQVSVFSGGNAQKLLLARSLDAQPRVLLLSEPTSGVDVGARAVIYTKLREACAAGMSVLMASSDFQEVVDVADRAVVLCRGRAVTELEGDALSVATLTGASYGI